MTKFKKLIALRIFSQTLFFLLFLYVFWFTAYPLRSALPPDIFFTTDPNIMIFTSISERLLLPGLLYSAAMLVLTFVLGRFFCGWVCPLGAMTDAVNTFRRWKNGLKEAANRKVRPIKYFLLALLLVSAVLGVQAAWIFDPLVIAARFISLNLIPAITFLTEKLFIFLMRDMHVRGPVYDIYHVLKTSVLGVKVFYFANAVVIFLYFILIVGAALLVARIWCRALCPLGAIYSYIAGFSLLRRVVVKCTNCGLCVRDCRMGAIKDGGSYLKRECILCMDCVYDCVAGKTKFSFAGNDLRSGLKEPAVKTDAGTGGVSRRDFLFLIFGSAVFPGFLKQKRGALRAPVIRPPAALREDEFVDRCVRCGNCMKVCPTNGLQPVMAETGIEGIWTPKLVPEIGYCEYNCNLCGQVCPTGAIRRLSIEDKKNIKLGTANIDRSICIPWAQGKGCIVCEEHCPVPEKAIKLIASNVKGGILEKPVIDAELCVGCGLCQNKCPVRPVRAVTVTPGGS